jgi:hypothetical protein
VKKQKTKKTIKTFMYGKRCIPTLLELWCGSN